MSGSARFDCYPSDFLNGVVGLTGDEIAAYTIVIMLQYDRGSPVAYVGREREIQVRSGLPRGRLSKAIGRLLDIGKLSLEGGALFNGRAAEEIEKNNERIRKNIENSQIGGDATKQKWDRIRNEINDDVGPTGKPTGKPKQGPSPSPSPSPIKEPVTNVTGSARAQKPKKDVCETPKAILESVLSPEIAAGVIEHRQKMHKPLTALAAKGLAKAFAETGTPDLAAQTMVERGWQGFRPDWFARDQAPPTAARDPPSNGHKRDPFEIARDLIQREARNGNSTGSSTQTIDGDCAVIDDLGHYPGQDGQSAGTDRDEFPIAGRRRT